MDGFRKSCGLPVLCLMVCMSGCADLQPVEKGQCDGVHPCPQGFLCVEFQCVSDQRTACSADEDCATGYCHLQRGVCVSCIEDLHCPAGVCHTDSNVCVTCLQDRDCAQGVCLPQSRTCVGCRTHADCTTGLCSIRNHVCLGCKGDAQCPSGQCNEETGVCEEMSTESLPTGQGGKE